MLSVPSPQNRMVCFVQFSPLAEPAGIPEGGFSEKSPGCFARNEVNAGVPVPGKRVGHRGLPSLHPLTVTVLLIIIIYNVYCRFPRPLCLLHKW